MRTKRAGALLVLAWLGGTAEAQKIGRPPSWLISTDWGMASSTDGKTLDLHGAGGLGLQMQSLSGHTLLQAEIEALPLWAGLYSARVGGILGWRYQAHYTELIGSSVSGNVQTNTYMVYPDMVQALAGLDLALNAYHAKGGNGVFAEAGFALSGQGRINMSALYDPSHNDWGMRIDTLYGFGRDAPMSGGVRLGMYVFFDFKHNPMPLMFTAGLAFGDGYHMK